MNSDKVTKLDANQFLFHEYPSCYEYAPVSTETTMTKGIHFYFDQNISYFPPHFPPSKSMRRDGNKTKKNLFYVYSLNNECFFGDWEVLLKDKLLTSNSAGSIT